MKMARNSQRASPVILFFLAAFCLRVGAVQTVSNLADTWTSGGIGDIHALFPGGNPYGSDTAHFTTGAGVYSLNSITLEFEFDSGYPAGLASPQAVNVQLFLGSTLLGTLANPVADSAPTQWPQFSNGNAYTKYIDFTPSAQIRLNPNSQYSLVISMPANSSVDAALLFARSSAYTSVDNWVMGPTSSGNPFAGGEYLKLAVNATTVPDAANTAALLSAGLAAIIYHRKSGRKIQR